MNSSESSGLWFGNLASTARPVLGERVSAGAICASCTLLGGGDGVGLDGAETREGFIG